MSKQWDAQKKEIGKWKGMFQSSQRPGKESAFVKNRIKREINAAFGKDAAVSNQRERGNPLKVIANESKPDPARRDKLMKLAKYNKDSGR